MFSVRVTYKNFNNKEVTKDLLFHLNALELLRLDSEYPGGLAAHADRILGGDRRVDDDGKPNVDANAVDTGAVMKLFEKFVAVSYGEKSDDGEVFDKSEEITRKFFNSASYVQLMKDLMAKDGKLAEEFFNSIIESATDF